MSTDAHRQLEGILRRSGTLTTQELDLSLVQATARNMSLWDVLVLERQVPEDTLAEALSTSLKLPRVRIESLEIEAAAVKAVAGWLVRKHNCLPIRFTGKKLVLAMANPLDQQAIQDVQFASSRQVEPVVALPERDPERHRETLLERRARRRRRRRAATRRGPAAAAAERDELNLDETGRRATVAGRHARRPPVQR